MERHGVFEASFVAGSALALETWRPGRFARLTEILYAFEAPVAIAFWVLSI